MGRIVATEIMPDLTGRTLDHGRYRLLENLGSGAYGKVYRAIDTSAHSSNQMTFAIKCLNKPKRGSLPHLLQQREFAHHSLVSEHPNVVTLHRYFYDGLYAYVVLDFCDGGDLFTAMVEKQLFHNNDGLIKNAFIQLVDAVEHCHKLGVFHRDIKPENVLCSEDGTNIRLADFGLSVMNSISEDFGCGSSHYMSPECMGRQTHRFYSTRYNDIWALGVILTNMLSGRNPWRYASSEDECFAAYLDDNDFLKQTLPISDGVNDILKNIFILNPLRRISLARLRRKVRALDALFTHENNNLSVVGADTHGRPSQKPSKSVSVKAIIDGEHQRISNEAVDSKPQSEVFYPRVDCVQSAPAVLVPGSSLISAASGSSVPESKGPITPATLAIDPPVDIPDISGQVLGYPDAKSKSGVINVMKLRKPVDILLSAVQRMKILSKAEPLP